MALTSANDAPERDPATFELWTGDTMIASGTVPAFTDRFQRQVVAIDSAVAASDYKLMFTTTASSNGCCMQVAEVELLGTKSASAPAISVVRNADGTLQTAPTVNGPWTDVDAASPVNWSKDNQPEMYPTDYRGFIAGSGIGEDVDWLKANANARASASSGEGIEDRAKRV